MRASLLAGVLGLGWAATAQASVVYDLTLTDAGNPSYSGSGSITLDVAPALSGQTNYASGHFSNLSFTVDGQTFTPPLQTVSAVQFLNGAFRDITFSEQVGTSPNRFSLMMTGNYAFYYNNLGSVANGTVTAALSLAAPVAMPEPISLALFGTALAGTALIRRRRR